MCRRAEICGQQLDKFRPYLRLLARLKLDRRLRGKLDASDLVQNTLLEAYQSRQQFEYRGDDQMAAWLRTILAHQLEHAARDFGLDEKSPRDKRNVTRERSIDAALDEASALLIRSLAAEQSTPSEHVRRVEQAVQVAAALETLPEAQREALVLHYFEGLTTNQVAEALNRTSTAVAGLLQRGLKKLRTHLEQPE